jgi:hypothetical protein
MRLQEFAAARAARRAARAQGLADDQGITTRYGVAAAIQGAIDFGAPRDVAGAIARELGADDNALRHAVRVDSLIERARNPFVPPLLGNLNAALTIAEDQLAAHDGRLGEAELAAVLLHAERFRSVAPPLGPPSPGDPAGLRAAIADPVRAHTVEAEVARLRALAQGPTSSLTKAQLEQADVASLRLVRNQLAEETFAAVQQYVQAHQFDPSTPLPESLSNLVREITRFNLAEIGQAMGPSSAI